MKYGIWFKLKDGTTDYYDPLDKEEFQETEENYVLKMTYTYEIPKEEVVEFGWYELCQECLYDLDCCQCNN